MAADDEYDFLFKSTFGGKGTRKQTARARGMTPRGLLLLPLLAPLLTPACWCS
jgi:hypothetical protein